LESPLRPPCMAAPRAEITDSSGVPSTGLGTRCHDLKDVLEVPPKRRPLPRPRSTGPTSRPPWAFPPPSSAWCALFTWRQDASPAAPIEAGTVLPAKAARDLEQELRVTGNACRAAGRASDLSQADPDQPAPPSQVLSISGGRHRLQRRGYAPPWSPSCKAAIGCFRHLCPAIARFIVFERNVSDFSQRRSRRRVDEIASGPWCPRRPGALWHRIQRHHPSSPALA